MAVDDKRRILGLFKKWVYDFLTLKLMGSLSLGGVKGWLVAQLFNKVWDDLVRPRILIMWRWLVMRKRTRELTKEAMKTVQSKSEKEHEDALNDSFK